MKKIDETIQDFRTSGMTFFDYTDGTGLKSELLGKLRLNERDITWDDHVKISYVRWAGVFPAAKRRTEKLWRDGSLVSVRCFIVITWDEYISQVWY